MSPNKGCPPNLGLSEVGDPYLAVMNVHFLFGLTVSHFNILQLGSDILAVKLLTCRTSERWDPGLAVVL